MAISAAPQALRRGAGWRRALPEAKPELGNAHHRHGTRMSGKKSDHASGSRRSLSDLVMHHSVCCCQPAGPVPEPAETFDRQWD